MSKTEVWKGNEALSEAAIRAGCRFYAGYPITPQTSITEYLSWRMLEVGGTFIQAESELAAVNMIIGAAFGGRRNMTATTGPGFSLMAEGISTMLENSNPCVLVDVQRTGAGTGLLNAAQSDYNFITKSFGHGGLTGMVFSPSTVQEAVDLLYESFDLADKYSVPVVVLTDGATGLMLEAGVKMPPFKELAPDMKSEKSRQKKPVADRVATNFGEVLEERYEEFDRMYESWYKTEARYEEYMMDDAEYLIISYGTPARIAKTAVRSMRAQGLKVGMFRAISLTPFPKYQIAAISSEKIKAVLTVEQAIPSMFHNDVVAYLDRNIKVDTHRHLCATIIMPEDIEAAMRKLM